MRLAVLLVVALGAAGCATHERAVNEPPAELPAFDVILHLNNTAAYPVWVRTMWTFNGTGGNGPAHLAQPGASEQELQQLARETTGELTVWWGITPETEMYKIGPEDLRAQGCTGSSPLTIVVEYRGDVPYTGWHLETDCT